MAPIVGRHQIALASLSDENRALTMERGVHRAVHGWMTVAEIAFIRATFNLDSRALAQALNVSPATVAR